MPAFRKDLVKFLQKNIPVQTFSPTGFQHHTNYSNEQPINDDFFEGEKQSPESSSHQGKVLDGEFERKE